MSDIGPVEQFIRLNARPNESGERAYLSTTEAFDFARAHDTEDAARDAVTEKLREARNAWFLQACGLQLRVGAQKAALKACAEFEDEIAKETSNLREALRQAVEALRALACTSPKCDVPSCRKGRAAIEAIEALEVTP